MPLPDGTLLICFLEEAHALDEDRPRVLIWCNRGPLEEVPLSRGSRQLLGVLASPRFDVPPHLSPAAAELRFAATLTASPPQRSLAELREAMAYSRTQEWRVRRRLAAELAERGLEHHLIDEPRGTVALDRALSDVSALLGAVRDGRLRDAVLLLRGIARHRPDGLAFDPPRGWPDTPRVFIEASLRDALRAWSDGDPGAIEAEDLIDAEVVEDRPVDTGSDDRGPGPTDAAAAGTSEDVGEECAAVTVRAPQAEIVLTAAQLPLPRIVRPVRRLRRGVRVLARLAGVTIGVALLYAAVTVLDGDRSEPRPISSAVAGPWPAGETQAVSNLTKGLAWDPQEMPASEGDVLLQRVRFRTTTVQGDWGRPVKMSLSYIRRELNRVEAAVLLVGPVSDQETGGAYVSGVSLTQRLRTVPGSTRLLDANGRELRPLRGIGGHGTGGEQDLSVLPGLRPGRVYFVERRMRVEPMASRARGELGFSGAHCGRGDGSTPEEPVPHGGVTTCSIPLWNWGPRALRRATVRCDRVEDNGRQALFDCVLSSSDADPPRARLAGGIINFGHKSEWSISYVPGSAEQVASTGKRRVAGDPLQRGVTVVDVEATGEFIHRGMPSLRFKVRAKDTRYPTADHRPRNTRA